MHIIYTLTQMPVSVVIKALKLEMWKYRHGYTEFVWRVFNPWCLTSNVHRLVQHNKLWAALTNTMQIILMVNVMKLLRQCPLHCLYADSMNAKVGFGALIIMEKQQQKCRRMCGYFINPALTHAQCVSIVPSQSQVLQTREHVHSDETDISSIVS